MSKMHLIKKEPFGDETISDESISCALSLNTQDHSFELFRKYICPNAQNDFGGRTNEKEYSEATRGKASTDPLVPFNFSDTYRPPSFLERALFPTMNKENMKVSALTGEKSSAQLTIFYAGAISVYDNISPEKAKAIMVMARGNYSVADMVKNVTKVGITSTRPIQTSHLCSISKLQAELPIARKLSLERFLKKRHDRIINKSPYAPPTRT